VRVKDGPLTGVEGILPRFRGKCRVVLSVELIQRSIAVEIEAARLARSRERFEGTVAASCHS
jgi:hypothetical protein